MRERFAMPGLALALLPLSGLIPPLAASGSASSGALTGALVGGIVGALIGALAGVVKFLRKTQK